MSTPSVELSMIVKDRASSLKRCLESVRDTVDRIVIGDTGSIDDSAAVARSLGAEVIDVPWRRDFAHARNYVLQHSRCDWILVLDSDEMLDNSARHGLAAAIAREDISAYDICIWNYVRETNSRFGEQGTVANPYVIEASLPYPAYGRCLNTRLFRRSKDIFFERPVHETVSRRVDAMGLRRVVAPFVIHHLGHAEDSSDVRKRKNELYQEIGREYVQSRPSDARTYFELGLGELEHYKRPELALSYFRKTISLMSEDAAAFLFAGVCLLRMRRFTEALEMLARSERLNARSIVLQEAIGDAHFHLTHYEDASVAYSQAISLGSVSALIDAKLGAAEVYRGLIEQGMGRVRSALQREPHFPELHAIALATAMLGGKLDLAAEIAAKRNRLENEVG